MDESRPAPSSLPPEPAPTRREEIRRHLLGCLEVALFMPMASRRFGQSREEMVRSFFVPAIVLSLFILLFGVHPGLREGASAQTPLLYTLQGWASVGVFLWIVSFFSRGIGRAAYFRQFVTAYNWLFVPAAVVLLPVLWMAAEGYRSPQEIEAFVVLMTFYTYAMTAFMTAAVLRVPLELGVFVAVLAMGVDQGMVNVVGWLQTL
ncbi:MAG TPA: hypothetical protein PKX87_00640 [Alphaproteobacteria bacterium]|nr:hypothetical protein [Alphaproteobacteria bacterium]